MNRVNEMLKVNPIISELISEKWNNGGSPLGEKPLQKINWKKTSPSYVFLYCAFFTNNIIGSQSKLASGNPQGVETFGRSSVSVDFS